MTFSIIIPVYNRPDEIEELLESFTHQTYKDFEIVIVEDGSSLPCQHIVEQYHNQLTIQYIEKENSGPGLSRNVGFEHANGEVFILIDSDCIAPKQYLEIVDREINKQNLDAFGGPDRAHESFTRTQKAINYSMTSFFTTGGIRNKGKGFEKFHPRSFNMGLKKEIFQKLGGFSHLKTGEDIEFSEKIIRAGYNVGLINDAFVFHKRRTTFWQFAKQTYSFGRGRVLMSRIYPDQLKLVHLFPLIFFLGLATSIVLTILFFVKALPGIALLPIGTYGLYSIVLITDALRKESSLVIASKSLFASFIQLNAYALGFISEIVKVNTLSGKKVLQASDTP